MLYLRACGGTQAATTSEAARSKATPSPRHAVFGAYLAHLERRRRDPKTVTRTRHSLDRLNRWLNEQAIDPLDAGEVVLEEYVAWLATSVAPLTANRETAHLKAAFRYATQLGILVKSPADRLEAPRVPEVEPEVYSYEELEHMRQSVTNPLDDVIFRGLAYTGFRRHELVELTWDEVDVSGRFMRVRGKHGKLRRVPLHPAFGEVLQNHRCRSSAMTVLGRGGSLRNVNQRLERLLKRAGIDGGNRPAHRFRKTVATVLYEENIRPDVIDRIMGWAPTTVRQRYYTRIGDEALYAAIIKLYPLEVQQSTAPRDDPLEVQQSIAPHDDLLDVQQSMDPDDDSLNEFEVTHKRVGKGI